MKKDKKYDRMMYGFIDFWYECKIISGSVEWTDGIYVYM